MLNLGQDNLLKVMRETSVGLFLSDSEGNEVLLPNKYVFDNIKIGDEITVFVYKDSKDRVIATTLEPFVKLNEFAYLKAKQNSQYGTFVDIGLEKDLLIPFRQQASDMEVGKWYVVYVYLDEETERLVGSTRTHKFIEQNDINLNLNQEVEVLVTGKGDLGWNVIVNNLYRGIIFYSDVFKTVLPGDISKAYVKNIREDGKLDISFRKPGYSGIEPLSVKIIDELVRNDGFLPYTDKTDAKEIMIVFEMSKKTFKKAIGSLFKQKIIKIEDDGIHLNDE